MGVGNKEDESAKRGKCVNDAVLLRNVCNGRQFVPQVSNMLDVMVCQGDTKHRGRVQEAAPVGDTPVYAAQNRLILTECLIFPYL